MGGNRRLIAPCAQTGANLTTPAGLDDFIANWKNDGLNLKPAFLEYLDFLKQQPGASLDFKMRPGISYSLRVKNAAQTKRDLYALIDVIDDDPDNRWLSVCFYADMVDDPDELGDFVPAGLLGEDARCFDLDEDDLAMRGYIQDRLKEAGRKAAQ